jgi:hypothetical protein
MNIFSDDVVEQTKKDFVWHEDIYAWILFFDISFFVQ